MNAARARVLRAISLTFLGSGFLFTLLAAAQPSFSLRIIAGLVALAFTAFGAGCAGLRAGLDDAELAQPQHPRAQAPRGAAEGVGSARQSQVARHGERSLCPGVTAGRPRTKKELFAHEHN